MSHWERNTADKWNACKWKNWHHMWKNRNVLQIQKTPANTAFSLFVFECVLRFNIELLTTVAFDIWISINCRSNKSSISESFNFNTQTLKRYLRLDCLSQLARWSVYADGKPVRDHTLELVKKELLKHWEYKQWFMSNLQVRKRERFR